MVACAAGVAVAAGVGAMVRGGTSVPRLFALTLCTMLVLTAGAGCSFLSAQYTYRVHYRDRAPEDFKTAYLDQTGGGEWLTTFDQAQGNQGFVVAAPATGEKRTFPLADACRIDRVKHGNTAAMRAGFVVTMPGAFGLVYGGFAMLDGDYRRKVGNTGWIIMGAGAGLLAVGSVIVWVAKAARSATTIYDGRCEGVR